MAKKLKKGDNILTTVRSWTVGKSKNRGTKYVRVSLDGYIDWTGWLTDKTTAKTMEQLAIMGFKGSNLGMLKNEDALDKNKEIVAVIGDSRDYKGKTYYSADWINRAGGFTGDNADLDEFADIDTRAYIDGAVDDEPAVNEDYSIGTDPSFTASDIPF